MQSSQRYKENVQTVGYSMTPPPSSSGAVAALCCIVTHIKRNWSFSMFVIGISTIILSWIWTISPTPPLAPPLQPSFLIPNSTFHPPTDLQMHIPSSSVQMNSLLSSLSSLLPSLILSVEAVSFSSRTNPFHYRHLTTPSSFTNGLFRSNQQQSLSSSPNQWSLMHNVIPSRRRSRQVPFTTTSTYTTTTTTLSRSTLSSSSTALHMVLKTPENIIEQASTIKLLDDLIDESVRTSARKPIMMQFEPGPYWIWSRWKGTVFSDSWQTCVRNMLFATVVAFIFESKPYLKNKLVGFNLLWGQLLSITTFTLTFFLNVSYGLWRKCYELSRRLQGRLNDLGLTMAAHADRITPSNPDEPGTYTPAARQVLELQARYIRVFNLLTYASFTRSHRPILTPTGMRRLVDRGLLTPSEREILLNGDVPATQRHNNLLLWIVRVFIEGREAGHIKGGSGFEQQYMEKVHVIRAQYGAIGDELQGRMPLAYAHIVQVLVDVVLWMYPFMAFTANKMSAWLGIFSTGLLTIFYQGLFDLAKQFLDPYDNENYGQGDDPLCVDTLVAETNAGSVRWLRGVAEIPFNKDKLKEGEMKEYLLPLRGYSVEQLLEMEEEERLEKERKEEEERQRQEMLEIQRLEEEKAQAEALLEDDFVGENSTISLVNDTKDESLLDNITNNDNSTMLLNQPKTEEFAVAAQLDNLDSIDSTENFDSLQLETPPVSAKETNTNDFESDPVFIALPKKKDKPAFIAETQLITTPTKSSFSKETKETKEIKETSSEISLVKNEEESKPIRNEILEEEYDEMLFDEISAGLEDFDWFEQIGPDGNEMRLSQMLADEVWEEELYENEDEITDETLMYAQVTEQAKEIIQAAKEEFFETAAILNASPGASSELEASKKTENEESSNSDNYSSTVNNAGKSTAPKVKRDVDNKVKQKKYDQTKLDSLSQLWGAGPEDLDGIVEKDTNETNIPLDSLKMESFSQLWSDSSTPIVQPKSGPESATDAGEIDSKGINQLWGGDANGNSFTADELEDLEFDFPDSSFDDLEWFNEVDPDGNELRLSQMLADEVWEEETEIEPPTVETFEDFSKKAIERIEAYEEELSETEAILNAPPGFQSLGEEFEEDEEDENENEVEPRFGQGSAEKEEYSTEECISEAILNAAPGSQSLDLEQLCGLDATEAADVLNSLNEDKAETDELIPDNSIIDESLNIFEMDVKLENEGKLRPKKSAEQQLENDLNGSITEKDMSEEKKSEDESTGMITPNGDTLMDVDESFKEGDVNFDVENDVEKYSRDPDILTAILDTENVQSSFNISDSIEENELDVPNGETDDTSVNGDSAELEKENDLSETPALNSNLFFNQTEKIIGNDTDDEAN